MKPINSKEKSKQVWQFIFIFMLMCIVPVALIFFSYFKLPEEISSEEQKKLDTYSSFEHDQKELIQQMNIIDTNLNLLAANNATGATVFTSSILAAMTKLKSVEQTNLQRAIVRGYESHNKHVDELTKAKQAGDNSSSKLADLQAKLTDCQNANRDLKMTPPAPAMRSN